MTVKISVWKLWEELDIKMWIQHGFQQYLLTKEGIDTAQTLISK